MDRNQSWFHGTTAGIIYHFKDPFNTPLQSDQSPEFFNKTCTDFGLCRSPLPWKQMSSNEGGQVSKKEIMTLAAN